MFWNAVGASAVDSYRFRETYEGWPSTHITSGLVVLRESAYRVELDPSDDPRAHDVIVSSDGEHEVALNRELRAFYDLTANRPVSTATSYLFRLLPMGEASASDISFRVDDAVGGVLEGRPTRRVSMDLEYAVDLDLGIESVSGRVEATATVWMTDEIALALPLDLRPGFKTGFAEIDAKVSDALSALRVPDEAGAADHHQVGTRPSIDREARDRHPHVRDVEL
jgi:hypothetical protein